MSWEPLRLAIFPMNLEEDEQGKYLIDVVLEKAKANIHNMLMVVLGSQKQTWSCM
eukprot:jgi/Pico_ML_1/51155/g2237.t1